MISPFIKWDHSEDYFVMNYATKAPRSERTFSVSINDAEFEYISGHLIDGK
jgi:hypothetical protein